jgi:sulfoxide reductase heme-binding subunit YedZ
MRAWTSVKTIKPLVFVLSLAPLGLLLWRGFNGNLGANPIEFITHATGDWTMRFLLITLAVTPARKLLSMPELIRYRRMLGLFAFFYGCLHLLTYLWLDKFFDVNDIIKDVGKRPFITAGFAAFTMLVPLAVTSTRGWIRRLGGKKWQRLHRLVYASGIAACIHYYWLVKSDVRAPLAYAGVLTILLAWRASVWTRTRNKRAASAALNVRT